MFELEKKAAAFVLQADEEVLWAERLRPRWDAEKICIAVLIVFCGVLYVVGLLVVGMEANMVMLAVVAGLVMLHGLWLHDAHTLYLLTDKRAIIVEVALGGRRPTAVTVPLRPQLIASCKRRRNGSADYFFVEYTQGVVPRLPDGFRNVQSVQTLEQHLTSLGIRVPQKRESHDLTKVPRPAPVLNTCWILALASIFCRRGLNWVDGSSWRIWIQAGVWAVVVLLLIPRELISFLRLRKHPFLIFTPDDNQ